MNRVAKGNARQRQCRKALESQGWLCYTAHRGFMGPIDILGKWDLICYKDGYFRLIQVKSNKIYGKEKERYASFKVDGVIVRTELWTYENYKRRTIEILSDRALQQNSRESAQEVRGDGAKPA